MIHYLSVMGADGERSLTVLNTEPMTREEAEKEIAKSERLRKIHPGGEIVTMLIRKSGGAAGASAEAELAFISANRWLWSLYDERGELVGSSNGEWAGWHCKTPMIDNLTLAIFILAELEKARMKSV